MGIQLEKKYDSVKLSLIKLKKSTEESLVATYQKIRLLDSLIQN